YRPDSSGVVDQQERINFGSWYGDRSQLHRELSRDSIRIIQWESERYRTRIVNSLIMMRQSSLLKWAQTNKKNNSTNRNWIHPPDALQRGHIAYLVKFLGCTEVEQAKGINVVKEGIRKLKFSQQLKRAEGTKTPKVELTISVDGVAVQEPKSKVRKILHQYPLHHISYCADDKSDKKFFSFIAKEADSDKHTCFVFVSDKLAEEITLTIGQAFDLAYRRFLETSGRDVEIRKQLVLLQKKVQSLESENTVLKQRIVEISELKDKDDELFDDISTPVVGTKLENLVLDDLEDFDPRGENSASYTNGVNNTHNNNINNNNSFPIITPPPAVNGSKHRTAENDGKDLFGANPFNPVNPVATASEDPFGMGNFGENSVAEEIKDADSLLLDKRFSEMLDGFSRGLSFGNDDFSLESLDPLHKSS
uniref:PID domain-containing protein n=1 Tax=Strigamia maritima TaxID=126957 RepID=T1JFF0_STRMM